MKRSSDSVSHEEERRKKKKYSSSESSSSEDEKRKKSSKKKKKYKEHKSSKEKTKEHKLKKHKKSKHKKKDKDREKDKNSDPIVGPQIPEEFIEKSKKMAPMTKEEWEKQQNVVKRVYDPETGRHRLVKGSGEILEEIVSKDMHKQINKQATLGDGNFFQSKLSTNL